MPSRLLTVISILSFALVTVRTGSADPNENREQIIARYGKPDDSYPHTTWLLDQEGFKSDTGTVLRFSSKGAPDLVILNSDGKSVEEVYAWDKDISQQSVMEILLRYSNGRPWRATKLDYPKPELVWRYTQPETHMHGAYKNDSVGDPNYTNHSLIISP